jgi:DNA-directed RNA polymerase specialized sigma24 family protein
MNVRSVSTRVVYHDRRRKTYLRLRLANSQEVDDVYQDVVLAIHVSRHTYEPARPV